MENFSYLEPFLPPRGVPSALALSLISQPSLTGSSKLLYRVTVILRRTAIRSARGGWVLNIPENTWPAVKGATMNNEAVVGKHPWGFACYRRPVSRVR